MIAREGNEADRSFLVPPSRSVAAVLTVVGLVFRLVDIGRHSFWFDEAMEILRALTPWPDILLLSEGADPPLLRLLLFPITRLTLNEFWLRLPAAVFGSGAIYLAYQWLSQMGQPGLGLITASLIAFAPVEVFYSQEVSQYSLSVFLGLAILIAFSRAAREGRWRDWLILWCTTVVALYTYYGLAWLLPPLDLHLLLESWRKRDGQRMAGLLAFHVGLAAAIALLYRLTLGTHMERFSKRKLSPHIVQLGFVRWVGTLGDQLYHRFLRFFTIPWSDTAPDLIPMLFGLLAVVGVVVLWLREPRGRLLIYFGCSTLLLLCIAYGLGLYPLGHRYALFLTPFFFLLIAAAIRWLSRWRSAAVFVASMVLLVFLSFAPNVALVHNPWMDLPRENLRPVVEYVQTQAQSDDVIYVYYGARPAYEIYQQESVFPTRNGVWFRDWTVERKAESIRQAVGEAPRFWIVLSHIYENEDRGIVEGLGQTSPSYRVLQTFRAEGAAAILLSRY